MNADRHFVFRLYCPHCQEQSHDLAHEGRPDQISEQHCPNCRKSFIVKTGVTAADVAWCKTTPPAIRPPEILEDSHPVAIP